MFVFITIVGVALGYAYAGLINRRLGLGDGRRWLFLVPVWVAYVGVLLTADMKDVWAQGVQSFAIASFLAALLDLGRVAMRHRRVDRVQ